MRSAERCRHDHVGAGHDEIPSIARPVPAHARHTAGGVDDVQRAGLVADVRGYVKPDSRALQRLAVSAARCGANRDLAVRDAAGKGDVMPFGARNDDGRLHGLIKVTVEFYRVKPPSYQRHKDVEVIGFVPVALGIDQRAAFLVVNADA